jgi:hypothetical protein
MPLYSHGFHQSVILTIYYIRSLLTGHEKIRLYTRTLLPAAKGKCLAGDD